MDFIPSAKFSGSLFELTDFHMTLVDTQFMYKYLVSQSQWLKENRFYLEETERILSWCITESVHRAFPEVKILDHSKIDKYEYVYDSLFTGQEHLMRRRLFPMVSGCPFVKCIRVCPMMGKTFIGIGS